MPSRYGINAKGRVTDEAYGVMRYMVNNLGRPVKEAAQFLHVSKSTVQRNVVNPTRPSDREKRPAPALRRGKQSELRRRRKLIREMVARKEVFKGARGPRGGKVSVEVVRREFFTATKIQRHLASHHGIRVSVATVRRDLAHEGYFCYRRPRMARMWEQDAEYRCVFARLFLKTDWKKFIFSDEKWANIDDHTSPTEYRKPGEEACSRQSEGSYPTAKVWVWGAIGHNFKQLVVFEKRMIPGPKGRDVAEGITAERYIEECLEPVRKVLTRRGIIFIQDRASTHRSNLAMEWLNRHHIRCPKWSSHSPDMHPIENMWAIAQRRVAERARPPTNAAELEQAWREEWDRIPMSVVNNLCESFTQRLVKCLAREGRSIM
jgi:transposase